MKGYYLRQGTVFIDFIIVRYYILFELFNKRNDKKY